MALTLVILIWVASTLGASSRPGSPRANPQPPRAPASAAPVESCLRKLLLLTLMTQACLSAAPTPRLAWSCFPWFARSWPRAFRHRQRGYARERQGRRHHRQKAGGGKDSRRGSSGGALFARPAPGALGLGGSPRRSGGGLPWPTPARSERAGAVAR